MNYQLVLVSFVIAIGHGGRGGGRILGGGWWLGVDSLLRGGLGDLLSQLLGQLLLLLGLLLCSLGWCQLLGLWNG